MEINLDVLGKSLGNWYTWAVIGIAAAAGIVGGLAHKLTSRADDKTRLGVYVIVGGVASLAVLYVLSPPDGIKLIALSLAAGYAGKSVLDALEARVKTALAQKDADRARETAREAIKAGKEATNIAQGLSRRSEVLEKVLTAPDDFRKEILESSADQLQLEAFGLGGESTGSLARKAEELAKHLDYLGGSLKGGSQQ